MKKAVLSALLMLLFLPAGYGQSKKRPVKSETWRSFSPPDKSFKVLVPTQPSAEMPEALKFSDVIGNGERYMSTRGHEKYFVGFRDYHIPIDDVGRMTKATQFFSPSLPVKQVFASIHPGVEKSEDVFGMEELFGVAQVRCVYRVFIIDQRLFVLAAFVPFDPASPRKNRTHLANAARFFNSFKPINFATLLPPSSYMPADWGIEVKGRNFSSRALDLAIQLPAGWKTELSGPMDSIGETVGMEHLLEDTQKERRRILFARSPAGLSEFWLTVELPEFEDTSLLGFVENRAAMTGLKPTQKVIGGREFLVIDLKTKFAGSYTVRRYYTEWKGRFLEIGTGFRDEADVPAMEEAIATVITLKGQ
jgi:hypothetical protein